MAANRPINLACIHDNDSLRYTGAPNLAGRRGRVRLHLSTTMRCVNTPSVFRSGNRPARIKVNVLPGDIAAGHGKQIVAARQLRKLLGSDVQSRWRRWPARTTAAGTTFRQEVRRTVRTGVGVNDCLIGSAAKRAKIGPVLPAVAAKPR